VKRLLPLLLAATAASAALFAAPAGATTITELPELANAPHPQGIAAGLDGNVWFTENRNSKIGRVNPATGKIDEFSDGVTANSQPSEITPGESGHLWFTEEVGSKVGRIVTGDDKPTIKEFQGAGQPEGIVFGPDGLFWIAEFGGNRIGTMTVNGTLFREFFTGFTGSPMPLGITTGPDGNIWFTELRFPDPGIGRITEDGKITEFKTGITASSEPARIVTGPDGNLWFTEQNNDAVGRITPAGVVTEFKMNHGIGSGPVGIVVGPDKNIWFAGYDGSAGRYVGRITTAGVITEFRKGVTGAPLDIAVGPDGNLWFTEFFGNRIGTVRLDPDVTTGAISAVGQNTASVAGTVDTIGTTTTYVVEYGTSTSYGKSTQSRELAAGSTPASVSVPLTGLQPGTVYHYRVVAANKQGTSVGDDHTFTTQPGSSTGARSGGDTTGPKVAVSAPSSGAAATDDSTLTINIGCPLAETLGCRGSVSLDTLVPRSGGRSAAAHRVRIGSARFKLGAGEKRPVKIRLSHKGRALVRAKHRLRVRVVVTARDHSGNRTTTVRALTLSGGKLH
jgi:streptogramin lyase